MRAKYLFFILIITWGIVITGCKQRHRNSLYPEIPEASIDAGEVLVSRHCQQCHMLPDPTWLDAKTWEEGALPAMGPYLGIFRHEFQRYTSGRNDPYLKEKIYPDKPVMNADGWQYILDYFRATAPDSLQSIKHTQEPIRGLPGFAVIPNGFTRNIPTTSYLHIDTTESVARFWMADLFSGKLFRFGNDLQPQDSFDTGPGIVDLHIQPGRITYCNIGELNPNNQKLGTIGQLSRNKEGRTEISTLLDSLARPVQFNVQDFNGDQVMDYLVCEFGYLAGSLSLYLGKKEGFERRVIKALPGAIKTDVRDFNGDGLPDIMALFAQGNESIFLFTNKGNGTFEEKQLLQFPPVYGSTYFELVDLNNDELLDIVYTCGDNADYSRVLKPYHGIYLFLNEGGNKYHQEFFYPFNGCYKAVARDFDLDGDIDLAAISFFADYAQHPEEGFVLLNNTGNLQFRAYTVPEAARGRWITLEAGDLDGDGRTDLVLGNFTYGPLITKPEFDWKKAGSFLFMKNKGTKP